MSSSYYINYSTRLHAVAAAVLLIATYIVLDCEIHGGNLLYVILFLLCAIFIFFLIYSFPIQYVERLHGRATPCFLALCLVLLSVFWAHLHTYIGLVALLLCPRLFIYYRLAAEESVGVRFTDDGGNFRLTGQGPLRIAFEATPGPIIVSLLSDAGFKKDGAGNAWIKVIPATSQQRKARLEAYDLVQRIITLLRPGNTGSLTRHR